MGQYKIVVGTTDRKEVARDHYNLVNKNDINGDIRIYKTDKGELYSVEVGPYSQKKQMLQDLDKIKDLGIINAFITSN